MNAIEITGLCKSYEGFALEDIRLTVPGGTIMGLIGENGAGKTTTIRCILGQTEPDAGTITVLGRDISLSKEEVGVVLDECCFHPSLSPADLDRILGRTWSTWDRALYRHYLEKFQVPEQRLVKELSRGMRMKLSLAAALAHRPKLLILDEATAGLDPVVRDQILDEFLGFICDEEHAILISSHITSDLEKVADYITYIHQGRVALSGSKDHILEHYGRVACTAAQLDQVAPGQLLRIRRGAYGCQGLVADRAAFSKRYPELLVEPTTLEDIMLFIGKEAGQ